MTLNYGNRRALLRSAAPAAAVSVFPQVRFATDTWLRFASAASLAPANGTLGTIGFRFKRSAPPATLSYLLGATVNDAARVLVMINGNGTPLVWLYDATQTRIARIDAAAAFNVCDNAWHTILVSWDTSNTNGTTGRSMYIDGVDRTNTGEEWPVSSTNVNYAATDPRYSFGAGQTTPAYLGQFDLEFFWADFSTRVDVTNSTNRDKFLAANIGTNGQNVFGSTPDYFLVGPAADWNSGSGINRGTEPKFFINGTNVADVGTPGTWP